MAKEHLGRYANTADCLRQVVAQEGLAGLATGLVPTLYRWGGGGGGGRGPLPVRLGKGK
jgi:hypothetical protein